MVLFSATILIIFFNIASFRYIVSRFLVVVLLCPVYYLLSKLIASFNEYGGQPILRIFLLTYNAKNALVLDIYIKLQGVNASFEVLSLRLLSK